jgi:hypothetical protein
LIEDYVEELRKLRLSKSLTILGDPQVSAICQFTIEPMNWTLFEIPKGKEDLGKKKKKLAQKDLFALQMFVSLFSNFEALT